VKGVKEIMKRNPIKILFLVLGFLCMGIGGIGVVLPLLPTTPFLLLAAFFFAKGSERFHRWFLSTKLYKKHLESFVKSRAMTVKTKLCILLPVSAMLLVVFFLMDHPHVRIVIVILIVVKYYYFIFRIRTIRPEEGDK
jgi:uncharacterized membrane protein YbaN (DUF454 family)